MGAAPERGNLAFVSPLRESEVRTTTVTAFSNKPGPQRFARVPTHAIGVARERRGNPRAYLSLPLRLTRVGGKVEPIPVVLVTRNISSSGVYFLAPCLLEARHRDRARSSARRTAARPGLRADVHRRSYRARGGFGHARLARLRG